MLYFIGFIVGILNGMFAAGAGQVLVFYLIFIKHLETHKSRALSVSILSVSSIFAAFGYSNFTSYDLKKIILLIIISCISGIIGTKIMKKIPSDILNLIAGVLLCALTIYKFFSWGEKIWLV